MKPPNSKARQTQDKTGTRLLNGTTFVSLDGVVFDGVV
jgi:hypothetical protein